MLKLANCLERQKRLLAHLEANRIALAIVANPKTIYYFTGAPLDAGRHHAFAIDSGGHSLLVTGAEPTQCAAEKVSLYTAYSLERVFGHETMHRELVDMLREFAAARPGPAAMELEFATAGLMRALDRPVDNLTPAIDRMRRRKDPDEIDCLRRVIAITEAGYAAVKRGLEPGWTECDAYRAVHNAMVDAAGTSIDLRGDFACGVRAINGGGPPTLCRVAAGELYIFDLFPSFEGYNCDLCRTFAVGQPTSLQQDAWEHVAAAHRVAREVIRPGVPARHVYEAIRAHLDRFAPARGSFTHHAGHGVGMDAWEFPWLTPGSDQVLEEGDVVACEPGLYSPEMNGGIRLEHNYHIGPAGPDLLDTFPLTL